MIEQSAQSKSSSANDGPTQNITNEALDDSLTMTKHQVKLSPTNKRHYFMTDNRIDTYGDWYAEYDTRKEAFQGALCYLQIRLTSGIPTRKPYVLTIKEEYHNSRKNGRKWEIKLEIANVTDKTPTTTTSNYLKENK